jgi:tetratricopeptide (TPR) repeat protein
MIGNRQKHEWLNAIFNNIDPYSEVKTSYSSALLLTFSLDVVFSIKANKTNIDLYLDHSNTLVKSNTLFQFYCAIITRFIYENKNDFVFELLERNILTIGIESGFSLNYQIGLASYILWLEQICLQPLISKTSTKLIEEHIERVHKCMENYSDALYVRDKLQWGQNYCHVIISLEGTLTEIEPSTWQEHISKSYVVALRVYSANRVWNEVNLLKEEGRAFCEMHGIENDAYSILNNYVAHSNPEKTVVFRDPKRSEFYSLNSLQWGQVILNIQMGRYVDSINYLNQNQQTHQTKFEFWYLLGLGYLRTYDDLSAIICFERSAQLAPIYINAYLQIANIHNKLEHTQLEIAILSKAYLIDSKHFDVVFRLAKAYQSQKDVIQAIKYYKQAVDLVDEKTSEYQVILRQLVTLYKNEAQWQEALDWCWTAIKHSNAKHEWLLELQDILKERITSEPTLTYTRQIHYESTINHLISCLKEFEDSETLAVKIATAFFKIGSIGDAWGAIKESSLDITTIAKIMSDAQSDDDVIFYTGVIYYQQEKYEAAILEWAKVLEKNPYNYEAHYYFSLANLATAKINSKLKLSKSLIKGQLEQAIKSAFAALYLGQSRTKTWELLGNIYLLLGQSNYQFLNCSYYSLEEVCFGSPNLKLIVALSQVKLAQLIEDFPHGKSQEIRLWLNDAKRQLVDWLQSYVELSKESYSPSYLNHHIGKTCLQICQIIRHNVQEEEYPSMKLGIYFRTAHKALSNVIESNIDKFPGIYQIMGDLYWEWHHLPGASNEKIVELKSAIQHWEKAQESQQNIKVSRIDRTIREELEISIGNARKKIKKLSSELA